MKVMVFFLIIIAGGIFVAVLVSRIFSISNEILKTTLVSFFAMMFMTKTIGIGEAKQFLPKNKIKRHIKLLTDSSKVRDILILWRLICAELDIPDEELDQTLLNAYNKHFKIEHHNTEQTHPTKTA